MFAGKREHLVDLHLRFGENAAGVRMIRDEGGHGLREVGVGIEPRACLPQHRRQPVALTIGEFRQAADVDCRCFDRTHQRRKATRAQRCVG